jgi:cytochrome b
MNRQRLWDLPTRLFHWLLVAGVAAAVITGEIGGNLIDWHGRAGLFILGLVTFRLVWGFVGSSTARFASFVRGPAAIKAYLRGEWRGIGHNPLGALAVLGLLLLTAAQVGTGLFANDDIAFQGPLADLVSKEWSDKSRALHALVFNGLLGLAALHVAAIVFYVRVKRQDLLKPMLTGWKTLPVEAAAETSRLPLPVDRAPGRGRGLLAFLLAAAVASTTVYAAAGGLLPPPPATPAATSPAAW